MSSLNAVYTMCFKDALEIAPDLMDDIVWDNGEHTMKLRDMIYSKFYNYEIAGETLPEQRLFMKTKFDAYKDYFLEYINAYETEITWLDGIISSETGSNSGTKNKTFTPRASYTTTTTPGVVTTTDEYDLPRSEATNNRPSSRVVSTPSGSNTSTTTGIGGNDITLDTDSSSHSITKKSGNPIEQKASYMQLLRSVYSEFADKFKACFITLYT